MTTITAKVIADSISPDNIRLTTLQLRYPRFIHSELMTHRVFSRNASSSRAVKVERMIEDIQHDTAVPIHWGKNQPGMQAREECNEPIWIYRTGEDDGIASREEAWLEARDHAIDLAQSFHFAGYHKQIINRLLEPFVHINVLVTSCYWANWDKLRDHPDAMPEICELAKQTKIARNGSTPKLLQSGEWHLSYVTDDDCNLEKIRFVYGRDDLSYIDALIRVSVARCARVSYLTHEQKVPEFQKDLELYERLVGSEPLHASPAEHQATPDTRLLSVAPYWTHWREHGNFRGWRQYRKMLKGEFVDEYQKVS